MVLHQQWAEDNYVNYKFRFVLDTEDGEVEISTPVDGRAQVGTEQNPNTVTYDSKKKSPQDFYQGYVGVVKLAPGQEDVGSITLSLEGENLYTFHYVYDDDNQFNYRIEY